MPLYPFILAISVSLLIVSGALYFFALTKWNRHRWAKLLVGPVANTIPPVALLFLLFHFDVLYIVPQVVWLVVLPVAIIGGLRNTLLSFILTTFTLLYFNLSFNIVFASAWLFVSGFVSRRIIWRLKNWKFYVAVFGTYVFCIQVHELIASKGNLSAPWGWYAIYTFIGVILVLLYRGAESILKSSAKQKQREQFYHQFFEQIKGYYVKVDRNAIITMLTHPLRQFSS